MTDELSLNEYVEQARLWSTYESSLRLKNRYVLPNDEYFNALFQACIARATDLAAGTPLYRARINPPGREYNPLPIAEMRSPPPERTPDGRVNPAGIPCFYAAFESETAIAEKRPWVLAQVTVAMFKTTRPLSVIDLRMGTALKESLASLHYAVMMIGRPVHLEDRFAYLGTQYLAERLKATGASGLLYDSALASGGTNVALFSETGLTGEQVALHAVRSVTYKTDERPSD